MKAFEYQDVSSVDEALAALPAGASADEFGRDVYLKAGGIDLLDMLKERTLEPDKLVNLRGAEDSLRYIKAKGGGLQIGPLATLTDVGRSAAVREYFPALAQAAGDAATPQIRNVATVGGNLCQKPRCWYFRAAEFNCLKKGGDTCFAKDGENQYHAVFGTGPAFYVHPSNIGPALRAVNAEIEVKGSSGGRVIGAEDFFVMPDVNVMVENVLAADEIITEIRVPSGIEASAHYEIREKQVYDWPLVAVSVAKIGEGWKVVMGAVASVPWRADAAEALLGNQAMTAELAAAAGEKAIEGPKTGLRYNRYKLDLIKVGVRRALMLAAGMETPA